ncbi:MAG TPA: hypothetical protein DCQ95_02720 [Cutibacterium acnes]|nr:hypothetical protein [Cutibacterium acnes]
MWCLFFFFFLNEPPPPELPPLPLPAPLPISILAVGSRRHGSNKGNPVSDGSNDALDSGDPLSTNEKQIDSQPELFS